MKFTPKIAVFCIFLWGSFSVYSQSNQIWQLDTTRLRSQNIMLRHSNPKKYIRYTLNLKKLKSLLAEAPKTRAKNTSNKVLVNFPDTKGKLLTYQITEASVMAPSLAKKYPNNKSYRGIAVADKNKIIRFSVNQLGLYAMVITAGAQTQYIDPLTQDKLNYMVYNRADLSGGNLDHYCLVNEIKNPVVNRSNAVLNANDGKLRTYRLALAATTEYSNYHIDLAGLTSGTDADKKAVVMAAMTTTMTRVNAIYERDLALTMVLVANDDQLIYLEDTTLNPDPYSNSSGSAMLDQNQTNVDAVIGSANYDIGHVFSTGGGGIAVLNSTCTNSKAKGVTGQSNPVGDAFDVDFVAHEMGHQFGATHTFNGDSGSCSGNRNSITSVEPGSGSTIMAYAGICAPQNVQMHSDDYFHSVSIQQMFDNISIGSGNCGTISVLVNDLNAPIVNAGADVSIPKSTPFKLTATASDADNDVLTYSWEQTDTQIAAIPPAATSTGGALFRSVLPNVSPTRYFPDLNTILSGQTSNTWEVLPSVSRQLNFDITIRDNVSGGGQTAKDAVVLTVDGNSGPFMVTSQNTTATFDVGSTQTITWDVAGTNLAPINCLHVNILLSIDGGQTYPIVLASNVLNDGSEQVVIPNNPTTQARIMVEAVDNVFFNVNAANFTIQQNQMALLQESSSNEVCAGSPIVLNYTYNTYGSFSENSTFSVVNLPAGMVANFNPSSASVNNTNVQLTLSNISHANLGVQTISVKAQSASLSRTVSSALGVYDTNFANVNLLAPNQGDVGVVLNPNLSWDALANSKTYNVQVATDIDFTQMVFNVNTNNTNYDLAGLAEGTIYYWRVKPINPCGAGLFSSANAFVTYKQNCQTVSYSGPALSIPDNNPTGISSVLNVGSSVVISDVNVGVNIAHQFIGDLKLTLTSPTNKTVLLVDSSTCASQNMDVIFDDSGNSLSCSNSLPGYSGSVKPNVSLSNFTGDNPFGDWTLFIEDQGPQDLGSLNSWQLEVCNKVNVPLSIDNFSLTNLKMWPNPSNGLVNIEMVKQSQSPVSIKIFDLYGRLTKVYHYNDSSSLFIKTLNLEFLRQGVYILSIKNGNNLAFKKLIVD